MKPWEQYQNQSSPKPWEQYQEKSYGEKIGDIYQKRKSMVQEAKQATEQGMQSTPEYLLQGFGKGGLGLINDVIGQTIASGASAITPEPIKEVASNVAGYISNSPAGDIARNAASAYSEFAQNNPRAARNIEAATNVGLLGLSATPIKGQTLVGGVADTAGAIAKPIAKAPIKAATGATIGGAKLANAGLEKLGNVLSETVVKSNLPKELRNLPKAEALFIRTLTDEGLSIDDAYNSLLKSREMGASPSVAASANIPQMKSLGGLMAGSSKGSRVAAKAIEDIEVNQIPKLNKSIIEKATGGKVLSAEDYGNKVSQVAKRTIDAQKLKLATRAKPYYQQSVGVDKSIDIQNPVMQKALSNPLAVDALEKSRTDPFTLTNVNKELSDLGVDSGDLNKLPYNSTVSLHAARVHLRGLADTAARNGEKQKLSAIKTAMNDIDSAIESQFPSYKKARSIYSEDAGALRLLNESPLGRMAQIGEGDLSKISNNLITKDPQYINKFFAKVKSSGADEQTMRNAIAGSFLKRKLEDSTKNGVRFSDAVLKNETSRNQLKAVLGEENFTKIENINKVIDELNETRGMTQGSRTALLQNVRDDVVDAPPKNLTELLLSVKAKYTPSLVDMVSKNPESSARFNELLFTDEGFKLLEELKGAKKLSVGDQNRIANFFSKQKVK